MRPRAKPTNEAGPTTYAVDPAVLAWFDVEPFAVRSRTRSWTGSRSITRDLG